ncbi:MAG: hypothetical protein GY773_17990 [Actinomycetia bacterium]|nr:hypothetical protein [Actinomycetes bacterium]
MAATETVSHSATNSLSTTDVDTITFTRLAGRGTSLLVTNVSGTTILGVTLDGSTPVSEGNDSYQVPAGTTLEFIGPPNTATTGPVVKIIGNANKYIAQLV